jgi:hypothetical protein
VLLGPTREYQVDLSIVEVERALEALLRHLKMHEKAREERPDADYGMACLAAIMCSPNSDTQASNRAATRAARAIKMKKSLADEVEAICKEREEQERQK